MNTPLESLLATGSKLWLDNIDPELVRESRLLGATGATSNPVIVSDLIATGRFDDLINQYITDGADDHEIAWLLTNNLVSEAQEVFLPVWEATEGNDGYVSFEVDPLLEDQLLRPSRAKQVSEYIRLGKKWSAGHKNRLIKVPATEAGLDALEDLVAAGVQVNVTLIFTMRQYRKARNAVLRGARRGGQLQRFKSVYSIFVSRVDTYTMKHVQDLSSKAQGMTGIANAKLIWADNRRFWANPGPDGDQIRLDQEIVFASTGTKLIDDPPWKYVEAFAGGDILTNPPATNDAVQESGRLMERRIEEFPPPDVMEEIHRKIDFEQMENVLMEEGIKKFADPQKDLLELISRKRLGLAIRERR